jgi:hypothetical protein
MSIVRCRQLAVVLLVTHGASAQTVNTPDPLFQSDELLEVRIAAPFSTLMNDRASEVDLPGTFAWTNRQTNLVSVDVGLQTRGRYRRQQRVCPFAPIWLNFKKSDVKDTLLEKQDKLKMVTHCRDRSKNYEQIVLKEYLTYRMLNLLTDVSYRVRLLRVTYEDTESDEDDRVRYAFLIEHKNRLSKRTGLPVVDVEQTTVDKLNAAHNNLSSIFNFFAGNTDFSSIQGARGETCCHNTHLFGSEEAGLYSVPYDFDMSGLVDAPYATPNPRLKIRHVRQRLYRGRCKGNSHIDTSLQKFRDNRDSFYALVRDQHGLADSARRRMNRFLDTFFDLIDDPKAVQKKLVRACL